MNIALNPALKKYVDDQIKKGKFTTAKEVIEAGLISLILQPADDFDAGELDELVAESESALARDGGHDADEVFAKLRARSAAYRRYLRRQPRKKIV